MHIETILYIISAIAIAMIIAKPHKFFMKAKELKPTLSDYQKVGRTERENKGMTFADIEKQVDELGELTEEDVIIAKNQLIAVFMGEQFKKDCIVKYIESNKCWACPEGETHYRMKYHNDWNQLMDVVNKIESVNLTYRITYPYNVADEFERVVKMIEWYNQNKK